MPTMEGLHSPSLAQSAPALLAKLLDCPDDKSATSSANDAQPVLFCVYLIQVSVKFLESVTMLDALLAETKPLYTQFRQLWHCPQGVDMHRP